MKKIELLLEVINENLVEILYELQKQTTSNQGICSRCGEKHYDGVKLGITNPCAKL